MITNEKIQEIYSQYKVRVIEKGNQFLLLRSIDEKTIGFNSAVLSKMKEAIKEYEKTKREDAFKIEANHFNCSPGAESYKNPFSEICYYFITKVNSLKDVEEAAKDLNWIAEKLYNGKGAKILKLDDFS